MSRCATCKRTDIKCCTTCARRGTSCGVWHHCGHNCPGYEIDEDKLNTMIPIKRFDDLGRVHIPKEIREYFGLDELSEVRVIITGEGILLRRNKREDEGNAGI